MAYVYGHYKKDTGELFYIGKGTGRRAWKKQHRTKHWRNIVNKHGLIVKILQDNLTEEEALIQEKELIKEIGLNNLVNLLEGGEGVTSEFAKRQFMDPEFRNKHKASIRQVVDKMRSIKKKQLADNPEYLKQIISVIGNPATAYKRYEKIECDVCGSLISKNTIARHKSSNRSCKKEFNGLSSKEISKIKAHEKYKRKIQNKKENSYAKTTTTN